ncbi:PREDICTED: putative hydroxypyruvate isomerase [Dinoponera quadriceps]|uniref:Putative hydroxypyruvate isomerase n=1 Tax=Dinoponera quadriceps TaxID=609295 RepID=A0A6P3Y8N9_DINQU|nr:PREDICTED: putative hydroxypyruvate isomerase [Dinoponera quadriceps]
MALKFASNLSFMFTEVPSIIDRYQLAKQAGFKAVESGFPFGFSIEQVVAAKNKAGVHQVLLNVFTGDITKGELGYAAIPGKEDDFKNSISKTIQYAKALDCKMIHVMSGTVESPTANNDAAYEQNLLHAIEKCQQEDIVIVIEPINNYSVPKYYMNNFRKGFDLVKKINNPYFKLQLDLFHLQHCCGNITRSIQELLPYVGHIQIAQVPDRHEPDTSGEIDYKYVLSLLETAGYPGYIGLEYRPKSTTVAGLKWIANYGYTL